MSRFGYLKVQGWQWPLQNVVPALIETIKELGLVLVADTSDDAGEPPSKEELMATNPMGVADWAYRMPEGVNGVMKANGILRFNDTIDMWYLIWFLPFLPSLDTFLLIFVVHILTFIQDGGNDDFVSTVVISQI